MLQREAIIICTDCKKPFKSKAHNAKWCPECRKNYRFTKKGERRYDLPKKKIQPSLKAKSIKEVLAEMKEYNAEHGTRLSYGQFVLLMEGRINNGTSKIR